MTTQTQIKHTTRIPSLIRAVDFCFALVLIVAASPVLIFKYLYRKFRYGTAIEHIFIYGVDDTQIALYQFTGEGRYCQWPQLMNLLKGDISLLGTEKRYILSPYSEMESQSTSHKLTTIKPGLLSFTLIHQQIGLSFEDQDLAIINVHKSTLSYLLALGRISLIWLLSSKHTNQNISTIKLFDIDLYNTSMTEMINMMLDNAKYSTVKQPISYHSNTHIQRKK